MPTYNPQVNDVFSWDACGRLEDQTVPATPLLQSIQVSNLGFILDRRADFLAANIMKELGCATEREAQLVMLAVKASQQACQALIGTFLCTHAMRAKESFLN